MVNGSIGASRRKSRYVELEPRLHTLNFYQPFGQSGKELNFINTIFIKSIYCPENDYNKYVYFCNKMIARNSLNRKIAHKRIILHPIDHATRLSAAVEVPSKHPKTIFQVILATGSACMELPNSSSLTMGRGWGDFFSQDFLQLCKALKVTHLSGRAT